jgi:hypothetical protein
MPMHDWTRVSAGTYHSFHQRWIVAIADFLNTGGLPSGYFALAERRTQGLEPDVLALELPKKNGTPSSNGGGVALKTAPPRTRFVLESEEANYARRADRLAIRDSEGYLVSIIEIVSPGNKDSQRALDAFVDKILEFLEAGVHVLIVDPFPPSSRDPKGIHQVIWNSVRDDSFDFSADKPLTSVSYSAGAKTTACIEPFAVGDILPVMPLFLAPGKHIDCALETSYDNAWTMFPDAVKGALIG